MTKPVLLVNPATGLKEEKPVLKIADIANTIGPAKNILSIIEIQSYVMPAAEINFREQFYSRRDLMSQWGVPDCESQLTWVFDLNNCDIEIEHTFGDLVCIQWVKGTKYMFPAKARTFYDFGRRDLIQIFAIHKPDTLRPKLIGRLISLEKFDQTFFEGILDLKSDDDRRLNTHPLQKYHALPVSILESEKLDPAIEKMKSLYFKSAGKDKVKALETEIEALLVKLV